MMLIRKEAARVRRVLLSSKRGNLGHLKNHMMKYIS